MIEEQSKYKLSFRLPAFQACSRWSRSLRFLGKEKVEKVANLEESPQPAMLKDT